jgi:protein ImuA
MPYLAHRTPRPCPSSQEQARHPQRLAPFCQTPSFSEAEAHAFALSTGWSDLAKNTSVPRSKTGKGPRLAQLRRLIASLETSSSPAAPSLLSLGVPDIHRHLPGPGLASGVLHEVIAATHDAVPATFAFLLALTSLALAAKPGLAILVASQRALAPWGALYGHGLDRLGVDPSRLMLVAARTDKEALWAMEEILRSRVRPAMVSGALARCPDLTASRRLNLAAAALAIPLTLACTATESGASAAATRWRISTLPASRDRFGALLDPCWSLSLERCRHGRPGKWFVEWNHVAHRFSLVEGMADRSPAQGTSSLRIAG